MIYEVVCAWIDLWISLNVTRDGYLDGLLMIHSRSDDRMMICKHFVNIEVRRWSLIIFVRDNYLGIVLEKGGIKMRLTCLL